MVHTDTWISSSIHLPNKFYLSVVALPFGSGRRQQWSKWKNHLLQDAGKVISQILFNCVICGFNVERINMLEAGTGLLVLSPIQVKDCRHCWLQPLWFPAGGTSWPAWWYSPVGIFWGKLKWWAANYIKFCPLFLKMKVICNYVHEGWNDCLDSFCF